MAQALSLPHYAIWLRLYPAVLAIAALAYWVPAWRGIRIHPAGALQQE